MQIACFLCSNLRNKNQRFLKAIVSFFIYNDQF